MVIHLLFFITNFFINCTVLTCYDIEAWIGYNLCFFSFIILNWWIHYINEFKFKDLQGQMRGQYLLLSIVIFYLSLNCLLVCMWCSLPLEITLSIHFYFYPTTKIILFLQCFILKKIFSDVDVWYSNPPGHFTLYSLLLSYFLYNCNLCIFFKKVMRIWYFILLDFFFLFLT